jgi:rRNA maturation protein Nop10
MDPKTSDLLAAAKAVVEAWDGSFMRNVPGPRIEDLRAAVACHRFSLDCPECGEDVFVRQANEFTDGEEETCSGCGSRVMVTCDSETPATAVLREEDGDG